MKTFDYWVNLYQTDRARFESERAAVISEEITQMNCPVDMKQRLSAMQWRFEQDLRKYKDVNVRLHKVAEQLWEKVEELENALGILRK